MYNSLSGRGRPRPYIEALRKAFLTREKPFLILLTKRLVHPLSHSYVEVTLVSDVELDEERSAII